jgi:hypothetical protein
MKVKLTPFFFGLCFGTVGLADDCNGNFIFAFPVNNKAHCKFLVPSFSSIAISVTINDPLIKGYFPERIESVQLEKYMQV